MSEDTEVYAVSSTLTSTPSSGTAADLAMSSTPSPGTTGAANVGGGTVGTASSAGLSSLPSSPSGAPNEKAKRYDRQLRLWGDHGQVRLERARVCLVGGADAVGCETLKSLVLPGVGAFAIVDNKAVTREDVGNNFFLDMGEEMGK